MTSGSGNGAADRLVGFASEKGISPFISKDLLLTMKNPIRFRNPQGVCFCAQVLMRYTMQVQHFRCGHRMRGADNDRGD